MRVMAGVPVVQQQCWLTFDHLKYLEAPNGSERSNLFQCSQLNLKPKRRKVFQREMCVGLVSSARVKRSNEMKLREFV